MIHQETSQRLFSLIRYCSKTQLSLYLEINVKTLDKQLNSQNWKKYQIRMIEKWYSDIESMKEKHGNNIQSIAIVNEEVEAIIKVHANKVLI